MGLLHFFLKVCHFLNVKLWLEGVDGVTFLVNISSVFKFCSEMQVLCNLVLLYKYALDPRLCELKEQKTYLEHICPHGLVKTVTKGLVFKLKFNCVVIVACLVLYNKELHPHCAFRNGFLLPRLAELYPVAITVSL